MSGVQPGVQAPLPLHSFTLYRGPVFQMGWWKSAARSGHREGSYNSHSPTLLRPGRRVGSGRQAGQSTKT